MSDKLAPVGADGAVRLPHAACLALCEDLPRAAGLDPAMQIVDDVRRELLGDGLLTVNLREGPVASGPEDDMVLLRLWSSNPAAYPAGGRKRKTLTAWSRRLLQDAQMYVGAGDADMAQAFDDHARITGLGLHCVVNVPLLDNDGQCFATFNVLGTRGAWQADEVMLVCLLARLATPVITRAASGAGVMPSTAAAIGISGSA